MPTASLRHRHCIRRNLLEELMQVVQAGQPPPACLTPSLPCSEKSQAYNAPRQLRLFSCLNLRL